MSQTLLRRGIEDSMYPKPRPTFERVAGLSIGVCGTRPPDPPDYLHRATVTVAVEFDPHVRTPDQVAEDVHQMLRPFGTTGVVRGRTWLWRAIRTHAWDREPAVVPRDWVL
jgi:hypothetical protein